MHRTRTNSLKRIILISKPDQIFDKADKLLRSSTVNGKTCISCFGCKESMEQTDFDELCRRLNIETPEYKIHERKLICEEFEIICCLMKKFLLAMNRQTIDQVMANLYNFGNFSDEEFKNTPACLVSLWDLQHGMNFNDHNELLNKYYPNENIENILKNDRRYEEAYNKEHNADFPRGVYYCLFHIFFETQFLEDPYMNKLIQKAEAETKIKSKIQSAKQLQQLGDKKKMKEFEKANNLEIAHRINTHKKIIGNYVQMLENALKNVKTETEEIHEKQKKYHGYIL